MSDADRDRWDARYAERIPLSPDAITIAAAFADHESEFPAPIAVPPPWQP